MANCQVAIASWEVKTVERQAEFTGILQGPIRSTESAHLTRVAAIMYRLPAASLSSHKLLHGVALTLQMCVFKLARRFVSRKDNVP